MNRTDLSARVAARLSLSRADANTAVNAVVSTVGDPLARGEAAKFAGFAKFTTKDCSPRKGPYSRSGEPLAITARGTSLKRQMPFGRRVACNIDARRAKVGDQQLPAAKRVQRQETAPVVVAVEEAPRLMAVNRVVGRVEVNHQLARRPTM